MQSVKKLFYNILLVTGTTLFLRTVSVAFIAYLGERIGASGIGIYQLILSVYFLAVTIASSGIRFSTTRLVSEEHASSCVSQSKVVRVCFFYALFFGLASCLLLWFFSPFIADKWLREPQTLLALRILSCALPVVGINSVLSGYFTAQRKHPRCALFQMIDQSVRILGTLGGLYLFSPTSIRGVCAVLAAGSLCGECTSFLLYSGSYLFQKHRHYFNRRKRSISYGTLTPRLLKIALPIAFSAYARSGLSTLQNILIPRGLDQAGLSKEQALSSYGTVHGMALPILLYPNTLMVVLSDLLLPELTECQVSGSQKRLHYMISRVLQISFLFCVSVMGVFYCFSHELSNAIYPHTDISFYLQIFAPLILVMYMDTVVDGLLKGLGEQLRSMKYNVIDSLVSVILIYLLVPIYGISGYVVTVMASELLNFILSLNRLIKITHYRPKILRGIAVPLLCIACTAAITRFFFKDLVSGLTLSILRFLGCYFVLLVLSKCLTREDLKWFKSIIKR